MSGKKIKVPRIRVFAINPKEDSKKAKMMEKFINYEWKKHKGLVITNVFFPTKAYYKMLEELFTPKKSSKQRKV